MLPGSGFETVHQAAPFQLILTTMAALVLVNLVVAQVVLRFLYPQSTLQFGLPTLVALAVVAGFAVLAAVRGWRAYLRRARPRHDA